mmetsp:Transcript_17950/g.54907  ORF Transcript_17950/g.54907 Transcript_17950/m.54907 type:complete len:378 (-) Transcript_17950:136-1269(-)
MSFLTSSGSSSWVEGASTAAVSPDPSLDDDTTDDASSERESSHSDGRSSSSSESSRERRATSVSGRPRSEEPDSSKSSPSSSSKTRSSSRAASASRALQAARSASAFSVDAARFFSLALSRDLRARVLDFVERFFCGVSLTASNAASSAASAATEKASSATAAATAAKNESSRLRSSTRRSSANSRRFRSQSSRFFSARLQRRCSSHAKDFNLSKDTLASSAASAARLRSSLRDSRRDLLLSTSSRRSRANSARFFFSRDSRSSFDISRDCFTFVFSSFFFALFASVLAHRRSHRGALENNESGSSFLFPATSSRQHVSSDEYDDECVFVDVPPPADEKKRRSGKRQNQVVPKKENSTTATTRTRQIDAAATTVSLF